MVQCRLLFSGLSPQGTIIARIKPEKKNTMKYIYQIKGNAVAGLSITRETPILKVNIIFMKKYIFLLISLICVQSVYSNKTDLIIIDPTVTNFDLIPSLPRNIKIYLGNFSDSTPSQANGVIGKTRTGIKTSAPIILKPALVEAFRKSFSTMLQQKGNLATDASIATYVMDLTITDCTLLENSTRFSQTLNAFLKIEVHLTNPLEADKIHTFTVETQTSRKSMDTTKYVMSTLQDAFSSAIGEIIKSTNKYQQ